MVQDEREHTTVLLPGKVQEWIKDFDWGTPVEPMDFELAVPSDCRTFRGPEASAEIVANRSRLVTAPDGISELLPISNFGKCLPDYSENEEADESLLCA